MNIQKLDDSQSYDSGYPVQVPQVMALPEMGTPRANPLMMIWRHKGLVVIVTVICLLGAMAKYMFSTQIFRSEAKLFVTINSPKGSDSTGSFAQSSLRAQCDLIKSPSMLVDVLAAVKERNLKTLSDPTSYWKTLSENLKATAGKDLGIITLSYDSPYPNEAQTILKAVMDAYMSFSTKEKRSRLVEVQNWHDKAQEDLKSERAKLLAFKKANAELGLVGDKGNLTVQQLSALQDALTQARLDTVNAKTAYDSAEAKMKDPAQLHDLLEYLRSNGTITGGGDSNDQALRSQLQAMEQQLDELRNHRYLPDHPSVKAAEATIATLRAKIGGMDRNMAEQYLLSMGQKVTAAKNREIELQKNYEEQRKTAIALTVKNADAEEMEREINRLAGIVDKAEQQLVELNSADTGAPMVQTLDEPGQAVMVQPVRNMILFQGLAIGLVLGCFGALVRDFTDQRLRSGDDITEALGVSMLGSVPHMPGPSNPLGHGRKVDLEPASDVAETYRTIRTAVFFGTPDRESRTILVTSPGPGEGKSTFASNLAIAMAQTGKRILLVDCDFRRPVQHRIFGSRPGIGLSTVLAGHEALDRAIQATGIAGLDILPAGPVPSNPSEILNSQSFNEVLEELSVRYEHVVVDSPAVMAVADARILAAMCSVTIMVLRAQSTTRKTAMHARRALQSVGAAILGVVVNDVPRTKDRYGDYGGYSSYRAKYNGHGNGAEAAQTASPAGGNKVTAMVPARSFLDLRRK
jgi:capsular exopolysaccharide synthesis family protein